MLKNRATGLSDDSEVCGNTFYQNNYSAQNVDQLAEELTKSNFVFMDGDKFQLIQVLSETAESNEWNYKYFLNIILKKVKIRIKLYEARRKLKKILGQFNDFIFVH